MIPFTVLALLAFFVLGWPGDHAFRRCRHNHVGSQRRLRSHQIRRSGAEKCADPVTIGHGFFDWLDVDPVIVAIARGRCDDHDS